MTTGKQCQQMKGNGEACGAFAVTASDFCFQHDPSSQERSADARRLGGLRRKREKSVGTSYGLGDLRTFDAQWRLLEIAATDALALENSPPASVCFWGSCVTRGSSSGSTGLDRGWPDAKRGAPRLGPKRSQGGPASAGGRPSHGDPALGWA